MVEQLAEAQGVLITDDVLAVDADWRLTFASPRAEELFGEPVAGRLGESMRDAIAGLSDRPILAQLDEAMRTRARVELRVRNPKTGHAFSLHGYPSSAGIVLLFFQMTDTEHAEKALDIERRRLEATLATLPVGLFVMDSKGEIVYANDAASQIWGGIRHVGIGRYAEYQGWWADTGDRVKAEDWAGARALHGETSIGEIIDIERFDGVRATIMNSASPILGPEGDVVGGVAVIQDITERRNAEQERAEHARYAQALNKINDALHSTLDFDTIMERVVVALTEGSGLDATGVHMRGDDGRWRFVYSYGLAEELRTARLTDAEAPLSVAAASGERPVLFRDARSDPRSNQPLMTRFNIGALLAVPLVVRGEAIAVLFTGRYGVEETLTDNQVEFVANVAATLGLALANARLFEAERRVADRLQEALLILPGRLPGIDFANAYHSASEASRVGGDFYDLFEMEHDRVGITIGDVAGKGLDAAVLTSLVKNTVRAHAMEKGAEPARILGLTNDLTFGATEGDAFVTILFAVLDCTTGDLVYANAGHVSGAIVRSHEDVDEMPSTGSILGAFPGATFEEVRTHLGMSDLLFLYTDGLTEARHGNEFLGEERVFELLKEVAWDGPSSALKGMLDEVRSFTGGHLSDDLAMLALRRVPAEQPTPERAEIAV